jgi:hypothetical protein
MHHHGSVGQGGAIQALVLATLLVTAGVHLGGRFVRGGHQIDGYLLGHALMTSGMVWMLLPESWGSGPPTGLAPLFALSGAWFAVLLVRECRRTLWEGAVRCGDLVLGHGAMAYMLAPPRVRSSPVTGLLVVYFLLLGLATAALVLGRSVRLELPEEAAGRGASTPVQHPPLTSLAASVSTASALAHSSMAVAMVFMLARS